MSTRLLGLLLLLYPFWAAAQQSKVVMTAETYAELQVFAEENGYNSPEAAYRAFKRHKAEQEEEAAQKRAEQQEKDTIKADENAANVRELETELQRVEARIAEEEERLRLLEIQNAGEPSRDIRLVIYKQINRTLGRIDQLYVTRESLQKEISRLTADKG